jgi:hypothetical protein
VSRDDLSARDRAVLFALLAEARTVSNPELKELIGFALVGQDRRRLNDRKLVESAKAGRAFAHELSDRGWRWCAEELAARPDGRGTSLERAHALVFGVFARYLSASGLRLADIVSAAAAAAGPYGPAGDDAADAGPASDDSGPAGDDAADAGGVAGRVEDGYRTLAPAPGEFVKLRELRLRLAGVPRPDLDAALTRMFVAQRINLIPQENQQALTAADRESALRLGGEDKHLISIE